MNTKKLAVSIGLFAVAALSSAIEVHMIVRLANGVTPASLAHDFPIRLTESFGQFSLYTIKPGVNVEALEVAMRADTRVRWADEDVELDMPEGDSNGATGQGAGKGSTIGAVFDPATIATENVNLYEQVNYSVIVSGRKPRPIRVAVLDTGLSPRQPYLWRSVLASRNLVGQRGPGFDLPEFRDTNANGHPDEALGHGTMVAGIIKQFAPECQLVIGKIADSEGQATSWSLLKGIEFARQQNCTVVNISMGSLDEGPIMSDIFDYAEEADLLIVAASGNNNLSQLLYPAQYGSVLSVTGVNNFDLKASYASYSQRVDVAAPSNGIKSAWWDGTIGVWSGTSFAAPQVAGTIADGLRLRRTNLQPDFIIDLCQLHGQNIDPLNPSFEGLLGRRLNCGLLRNAIFTAEP